MYRVRTYKQVGATTCKSTMDIYV